MAGATPESCDSCRFYLSGSTDADAFKAVGGMCRRYAPTGPIVFSGGSWQCFPPMPAYQWCGDYRPAEGSVVNHARVAA